MGILDRVIKSPKKEENTDINWIKTDYGYALKESIKVHFTPEMDVYPKYPRGGEKDVTLVVSHLEDVQQDLKHLDSKTFYHTEFLSGKCPICKKNFIIPKSKNPPFFKCPLCSEPYEKTLIELLLFLNPDNEIFGSCPECNKYSYLKVNEESRYLNFHCISCDEDLFLDKDHPIEMNDLSENSALSWCSACGLLFEVPINQNFPSTCSRCESKLEPKK